VKVCYTRLIVLSSNGVSIAPRLDPFVPFVETVLKVFVGSIIHDVQ
jgi:hypothetical protein